MEFAIAWVRAMRRELVCTAPTAPPCLEVRSREQPRPKAGQLLVRVKATSVNPIDVKRASGYGRRLLGVKGAANFPLVLGNDLAGEVEAVGTGVSGFSRGQHIFGLVATSRAGGAHSSHVVVPQEQVRAAPEHVESQSLAVLPYSFTTMWLAVRSCGLNAANATGTRVLLNGASGALGRLSLQLLRSWGSDITAICGRDKSAECLSLGAVRVVERGPASIASLPANFHVVLNFGSWDDELALASRLDRDALGHATTVHPLLGNFDRLGLMRGALANRRAWLKIRAAVEHRAAQASYSWTVFKPDRDALDALAAGLRERSFSLPVATHAGFETANAAFAHVAAGKPGRAVLLP